MNNCGNCKYWEHPPTKPDIWGKPPVKMGSCLKIPMKMSNEDPESVLDEPVAEAEDGSRYIAVVRTNALFSCNLHELK